MPKIVDHDARRRDIVHAASRIIGTRGLDGATVREIAREAEWSSGTLAHYFANREDILISCLEMAHRGVRIRTEERLGGRRGLEALRILLLEALPLDAERLLEAKIEVCLWGAAVGNEVLRTTQNKEVEVFHSRIRALLVQAEEDGELAGAVTIDAAVNECRMLVDSLSVQAVMRLVPPDGVAMTGFVNALLERLGGGASTHRKRARRASPYRRSSAGESSDQQSA
jgi:AcrR family transcriptional regulator